MARSQSWRILPSSAHLLKNGRVKRRRSSGEGRLKDAIVVADRGLGDALKNLKKVSHGKAVRELMGHAGNARGLDCATTKALIKKAGDLYPVRLNLSQAGNTDIPDVHSARNLVELVLDQAVVQPSLLGVPRPQLLWP